MGCCGSSYAEHEEEHRQEEASFRSRRATLHGAISDDCSMAMGGEMGSVRARGSSCCTTDLAFLLGKAQDPDALPDNPPSPSPPLPSSRRTSFASPDVAKKVAWTQEVESPSRRRSVSSSVQSPGFGDSYLIDEPCAPLPLGMPGSSRSLKSMKSLKSLRSVKSLKSLKRSSILKLSEDEAFPTSQYSVESGESMSSASTTESTCAVRSEDDLVGADDVDAKVEKTSEALCPPSPRPREDLSYSTKSPVLLWIGTYSSPPMVKLPGRSDAPMALTQGNLQIHSDIVASLTTRRETLGKRLSERHLHMG